MVLIKCRIFKPANVVKFIKTKTRYIAAAAEFRIEHSEGIRDEYTGIIMHFPLRRCSGTGKCAWVRDIHD